MASVVWILVLVTVCIEPIWTLSAGHYGASDPKANGWGANFGRAPILERFSWNILDWAYPDQFSRDAAMASGDYVPQNGLPVGIEIWQNKLFVTVPRWKNGQSLSILIYFLVLFSNFAVFLSAAK